MLMLRRRAPKNLLNLRHKLQACYLCLVSMFEELIIVFDTDFSVPCGNNTISIRIGHFMLNKKIGWPPSNQNSVRTPCSVISYFRSNTF